MSSNPLPAASELTVEEQASLTTGADFWTTKEIEGKIPSILMTDGPHGLRKQAGANDHLGLNESGPATCFPPAAAMGATFDPELVERVGKALGTESAIEDVAVILGPGINIKRSPLCGRNFEYVSEDPLVAAAIGTGLVKGIQSKGVGASLKHFAANNQEDDRMRSSSNVDARPLQEIYLRAFKRVVQEAQPWTVMCSYNRINGVFASENHWLLTETLRERWGFKGLVVSDWGAVNVRTDALKAGLDLEMPYSGPQSIESVIEAVRSGQIAEEVLSTAAGRVIDLVRKAEERPVVEGPLDVEAHHDLAREVAGRSIVLLKNDPVEGSTLLPLQPGKKIALIGEFARTPRFQGGGSSHINPTKLDSVVKAFAGSALADNVSFAPGFTFVGSSEEEANALKEEAVELAVQSDVVVLFLGLTDAEESEGADRTHIDLSKQQLELLDAVTGANPATVVVLSNGSVVALPFVNKTPAIVEAWLLGQAGGSAIVDVLLGDVNPSGRLAETIPLRLEDTPAFGNFPGEFSNVRYGEGIFVGYRWYDQRNLEVTYPFGHGLCYTTFEYGDAQVSQEDSGDLVVVVPITNTGERAGREVVQVYASPVESVVERAPRELKGFKSVELQPGETKRVQIPVRREDLAYWDVRVDDYIVEGGSYRFEVGSSSRQLHSTVFVDIVGDAVRAPLSLSSTIGELLQDPVVGPQVKAQFGALSDGADEGMMGLIMSFPLGRIGMLGGLGIDADHIEQLISLGNSSAD